MNCTGGTSVPSRLAPAHQHFGAHHARVGEIHDRLVIGNELAVADRPREFGSRIVARAHRPEGDQREDQHRGRAGAGRCGRDDAGMACQRLRARHRGRRVDAEALGLTCAISTQRIGASVFAALRSPITMPSPVARLAVMTTRPAGARDARDQQMSDGMSAASHAPRRRSRGGCAPRCPCARRAGSPRSRDRCARSRSARAPDAGRTESPDWCIAVRPSGPTMETSLTGTTRNEISCMASRSASSAGAHVALGEFVERLDGAIEPRLGERDHAPRRDVRARRRPAARRSR